VARVNGIAVWAEGIKAELKKRLPRQRKTQRDKLAVLVATMLHVRSANLVELAAGLPRESERRDMGYQWISRFLANDLVCCDTVMEPFAREVLARRAGTGDPLPLILDQTKASDRHQLLMLSVRWPSDKLRRACSAAGLAGRGERGRHRFRHAKRTARSGRRLGLPADQNVILLADRFYGTPEMIRWCRDRGWNYRLRLKSNLLARRGASRTTTGALALLSLSKGRRPLFRGCRPHRQPAKLARGRLSWFTRGLRRAIKLLLECLPLPKLWGCLIN
jgi:hypothetical protein